MTRLEEAHETLQTALERFGNKDEIAYHLMVCINEFVEAKLEEYDDNLRERFELPVRRDY